MTGIINNIQTVTDSNIAMFSHDKLTALHDFAKIMAAGISTVPAHLQGNVADCMAVCMQSAQWKMNPYAVAQKTHLINGVLGYEAQLVNAVITTRGPLVDRIHYDWFGPWENVIGKFKICNGREGKDYRQSSWNLTDEDGVGIRVWATLLGENTPRELTLLLTQARVRNSTLWADDPRQQLAYLAVKRWASLYCPEVILGIYTPEEVDDRAHQERNITPPNDLAKPLAGIESSGSQREEFSQLQNGSLDISDKKPETPEEILCWFINYINNQSNISAIDNAYTRTASALAQHQDLFEKATNALLFRKAELDEIPL
ncbi:RecT family recombinase [Yersinia alsatica]|uniref:RecT family recombinase n=1 Tax=Yersinia alsatica TaxID=2890317 RepID=UPI0032EFF280